MSKPDDEFELIIDDDFLRIVAEIFERYADLFHRLAMGESPPAQREVRKPPELPPMPHADAIRIVCRVANLEERERPLMADQR